MSNIVIKIVIKPNGVLRSEQQLPAGPQSQQPPNLQNILGISVARQEPIVISDSEDEGEELAEIRVTDNNNREEEGEENMRQNEQSDQGHRDEREEEENNEEEDINMFVNRVADEIMRSGFDFFFQPEE